MNDLTLTPPAAVGMVEANASVSRFIELGDERIAEIRRKVNTYLDDMLSYDHNSPKFSTKQDALANVGSREIREASRQLARFMDQPMRAATAGAVGSAMALLRDIVRRLDPSRLGDLMKPRMLLGFIPVGSSRLQEYFDQYAPAQKDLADVLTKLSHSRDDLLHDNAAITGERERMYAIIRDLEAAAETALYLDQETERRAAALDATMPARAQALRKGALYHARQRSKDLLTQLAVSIQGYQSLDLIQTNNIELIKGIERASTTTVAALKTAMAVAEALNMQKLVLDRIGTLNRATATAMDATGRSLRALDGGAAPAPSDAAGHVAALSQAFQSVSQTVDTIDSYRLRAVDSLKATGDALAIRIAETAAREERATGALSLRSMS